MKNPKVGELIKKGSVGRDAIHIAVAPVVATHLLNPGEWIRLVDDADRPDLVCAAGELEDAIGIVDPFLAEAVEEGQQFWLFLTPETITSLRHEWTHPAFPESAPLTRPAYTKEESELWLRRFAAEADCPRYDILIAAAIGEKVKETYYDGDDDYYTYRNEDGCLHFTGWDAHGSIPAEFWDHVEVVTGKTVPADLRAKHFSCSC